jgi:hypothetical protein
MSIRRPGGAFSLPAWAPITGLTIGLVFAWLNFLTTARWASQPGALNGWKRPWYALALIVVTALVISSRRHVGRPVRIGWWAHGLLIAGMAVIATALLCRLPPSSWLEIPFKDDWTPLYQQAVNGAALLRRGVVVGWNWSFLGGYPTSTDIAQNFAAVAFVPMSLLGPRLGYHVFHVVLFLAVPFFVWWDLRGDDRETRVAATGLACFFAAGYLGPIGSSGDTNSLVGVFCAGLAMMGGRAARLQQRWGGPVVLLGLTLALYSHAAFFVYAVIYLALEAAYFRDRAAGVRLATAAPLALAAALPMHWESLRHAGFVSFNNTVYSPGEPVSWPSFARLLYYNVEILALPHRWFNDYRSVANVWLAAIVVMALQPGRRRVAFYAVAAVLTQGLLRLNTPEAGAGFDRIQHMLPLLVAPALAGFVLSFAGTRRLAIALFVLIALYVQTTFTPIRHVPDLRAFDPALVDRIASSDGMVLVEVSPHRDMDSHPTRRTRTTPFDVHFEGLLPDLAGQRFYSQSVDGWVWNIWRGQVVGAGTYAGRPIADTPADDFVAEMRRWGVRHLFVWTDETRTYLAGSGRFTERWRGGYWSHFELAGADIRSVVTTSGSGQLRKLDALGAEVDLAQVASGDLVTVRANYYPAWKAFADGGEVPLFSSEGQLAFRAPAGGSYAVRLEYPRYRWLSAAALVVLVFGIWLLSRPQTKHS